jgi:hypothetical protein
MKVNADKLEALVLTLVGSMLISVPSPNNSYIHFVMGKMFQRHSTLTPSLRIVLTLS